MDYPLIAKLGVRIHREPLSHCRWDELWKALGDRKEEFNKLFGIQTCMVEGAYAWDVERVLEKMNSVKHHHENWD